MRPRRDRSIWRTAACGIAAAGLLGLGACSGGLSNRSVKPSRGQCDLGAGIRRVRIESRMGSLEVDAGEPGRLRWVGECLRAADTAEDLARLERTPSEFQIAPDPEHADVLVLHSPELPAEVDPLRAILGIEARVWLPPDLDVEVEVAGSGHLTAVDRRAAVQLRTGRGDLRIACCCGPALLRTGGGMTIVDRHEGDLDVRAEVGDLQVWVRKPADKVTLVTGSGTIQCHLPPDAGFRLDGRTLQGKASASDYGIQADAPATDDASKFSRVIQGMHGDAHTVVVLRTGIGHLSLRAHTFE